MLILCLRKAKKPDKTPVKQPSADAQLSKSKNRRQSEMFALRAVPSSEDLDEPGTAATRTRTTTLREIPASLVNDSTAPVEMFHNDAFVPERVMKQEALEEYGQEYHLPKPVAGPVTVMGLSPMDSEMHNFTFS